MPQREHSFNDVVRRLTREYKNQKQRTAKIAAVPFGQEQLSARDALTRLRTMPRAERQRLLQDPEKRRQVIDLLARRR